MGLRPERDPWAKSTSAGDVPLHPMKSARHRPAEMLRGHGIEIGAMHLPLPVPQQARVTYVDRLPVEKLREHYEALTDQQLTPVDVVGSAEDLSAFATGSLDFVIANHLIEHLEDAITAIKEFHRVLRAHGLLFMCVPDARVTFDRLRPLTPTEHILAEADEDLVQKLLDMEYSIHFHVWNADTFLDFFQTVCREEELTLDVLDAVDTTGQGSDELILLMAKRPTLFQRIQAKRRGEQSWSRNVKEMMKVTPAGPALMQAGRLLKR
jgi:hypothetical protein